MINKQLCLLTDMVPVVNTNEWYTSIKRIRQYAFEDLPSNLKLYS